MVPQVLCHWVDERGCTRSWLLGPAGDLRERVWGASVYAVTAAQGAITAYTGSVDRQYSGSEQDGAAGAACLYALVE